MHEVHPLTDPRWSGFVEKHPQSSVFHTKPWMDALERTYGYEAIALTTSPPHDKLRNAVVFCMVRSPLTGHRLVSLPFSDHCEPLIDDPQVFSEFLSTLEEKLRKDRLRYIEIRPMTGINEPTELFHSRFMYYSHQLDLTPRIDDIFRNLHKDSTRRKILRAWREGLVYEYGASKALLDTFLRLHVVTRQRQGIPPQPKQWFENLVACFGNSLKIRVASRGDRPIAAILTITHKNTLVYKYGASDARFNNLGGTHLLFWRSIEEAKHEGMEVFDLGRSDAENAGLVTFKNRWGAKQSTLYYSRFTLSAASNENYRVGRPGLKFDLAKRLFAYLPKSLSYGIGKLLYKHIG